MFWQKPPWMCNKNKWHCFLFPSPPWKKKPWNPAVNNHHQQLELRFSVSTARNQHVFGGIEVCVPKGWILQQDVSKVDPWAEHTLQQGRPGDWDFFFRAFFFALFLCCVFFDGSWWPGVFACLVVVRFGQRLMMNDQSLDIYCWGLKWTDSNYKCTYFHYIQTRITTKQWIFIYYHHHFIWGGQRTLMHCLIPLTLNKYKLDYDNWNMDFLDPLP